MSDFKPLRLKTAREKGQFYTFNREERNIAALLYAQLLSETGLKAFMEAIGQKEDLDISQAEVYFEFSMLRDLWANLGDSDSNGTKRELIENALGQKLDFKKEDISGFNTFFGARGSEGHIESPSNWSLPKMDEKLQGELFVTACKLKWAFNAKPDLVIVFPKNKALCVECKWESGESKYPSSKEDIKAWKARGQTDKVSQTEIQKHIFSLLGYELIGDEVLVLTKKDESAKHSWSVPFSTVFNGFNFNGQSAFGKAYGEWVKGGDNGEK